MKTHLANFDCRPGDRIRWTDEEGVEHTATVENTSPDAVDVQERITYAGQADTQYAAYRYNYLYARAATYTFRRPQPMGPGDWELLRAARNDYIMRGEIGEHLFPLERRAAVHHALGGAVPEWYVNSLPDED